LIDKVDALFHLCNENAFDHACCMTYDMVWNVPGIFVVISRILLNLMTKIQRIDCLLEKYLGRKKI